MIVCSSAMEGQGHMNAVEIMAAAAQVHDANEAAFADGCMWRFLSADDNAVTFKCKDYRLKGRDRYKTMSLAPHEFIRRFLMHVLPHGFHRIRHYGLFANGNRAHNIARARELLAAPELQDSTTDDDEPDANTCPSCGGRMILIETFEPGCKPRSTSPPQGIDSS